MGKPTKSIPTIQLFVRLYLAALLAFSFFRVILLVVEHERIDNTTEIGDILRAFGMGVRFDIVVTGYILALPYVFLCMSSYLDKWRRIVVSISYYYLSTLFALSFLVCAIDIPYFGQFFSRFSITFVEWISSPAFLFKMILQEPRYWLFLIPYLLVVYLYIRSIKGFLNQFLSTNYHPSIAISAVYLVFGGLIFLGIRGRLDKKSPIRVGTAYFCNNPFLNQLGLNPNFTLLRSYLDSLKKENQAVSLMDDSMAISNMRQYLGIKNTIETNSITRPISFGNMSASKQNIVLVIMESMSAAWMKRHGNALNITPFLDSLSNQGLYFENVFTAGIHTHNGIFSTLFSYPALFRQHAMKESSIANYGGIFHALKKHGYSSIYFTTHDGQFDNVEGFLRANGCDNVISKPNYPSNKIKTTLGVPDDYMFEYAIPVLNDLHKQNKPFFAAFMTASNHKPYYLPDYFKPSQKELRYQMVEYSDFSLNKFLKQASKETWFENTLFVFVADHGAPLDGAYEMSLAYNHTPLIFYAPKIIGTPKSFTKMGGQIDVFPTIMGLLQLPYENSTLGIDLTKENRPYVFFSADDKYGVLDENWFLVVKDDGSKFLYNLKDQNHLNQAEANERIVFEMDRYAKSNLQTCQAIFKKQL